MLVADYIESGIVPAAVQMLDEDSPDEFRAEGVMVCRMVYNTSGGFNLLCNVCCAAVVTKH